MAAADNLTRGRDSYRRRAWAEAYRALSLTNPETPLDAEDLERLAISAYLVGRDDECLKALDRAHHGYEKTGRRAGAVRCAFWLGFHLFMRGEIGRANGWFARARRSLDREKRDCVEQGYLLLPVVERRLTAGDTEAAYATAAEAAGIGERFGDADLVAAARHQQGRALLRGGRVEEGLALLDEAMLAVIAGNLSPLITGLVYCSVIDACQRVYALDRAREWTSALARWCDAHPEMVAFRGTCLVHRAEILQLHGEWRDALAEARRACERYSRELDRRPPAAALYRQAEVHRLRGEFAAAEEAYRKASEGGCEPLPGLALLRLSQGRTRAAAAAMRRILGATTDRLERTRLLAAHVEVMLAAGDVQEARAACDELQATAHALPGNVLDAMAAQARGAVALAEGDARAALESLRRAWRAWQEVEAPYESARVRVLAGSACRAMGDDDGARLELDAARVVFERLGAAPDLARIDSLGAAPAIPAHGLTPRELQVLRSIASGKTNRAIAAELFISEKTVARHVSNIFGKLGLSTRTAAAAYAHRHGLA